MNKNKQKLIAILTALTFVLLAGCTDNKPAETPKTPEKQVETQAQGNQPTAENKKEEQLQDGHENEADLKTFISKEGGFSLVQPEMWNDNVSAVEGENDEMKAEWETSFHILVDGKADKDSTSLMTITKMTKANYEALVKEEGPMGEKLAENDKHVWMLTLPQANPYEEKSDEFKKFNDMMLDFEFVKKNFKINN
ncbi:hypothetical protein NQ117_14890 [Paenibacillus sp. SC116]|uniref:hypothetical protein n=1 Tax=Paenibacillus sp. SC116 TaxID=2968986 RepID=UPI00215AE806|nr:hypothetical protein [Paenibacillus sp. SC116]MCR8844966.1 hypothetical protein [Paenibacillus sp. SC116]